MRILFTILLLALFTVAAQAQAQTTVATAPQARVYTELIASTESLVKGAPFSAEAINESVQVLADGNRIVRSSSSKMYRDSEGRFRRDGSVSSGSLLGNYTSVSGTTITDPVAGFKYYLNDKTKTFRKAPFNFSFGGLRFNNEFAVTIAAHEKMRIESGVAKTYSTTIKTAPQAQVQAELEKAAAQGKAVIAGTGPSGTMTLVHPELTSTLTSTSTSTTTNTESLGTRNFDGVEAEGTRTTVTIAAGAIGNERPIETVYEKWYSKQLQMIVYSKNSDPRFGEQTYRLNNISRNEPDPSVFTVPEDYKVQEERMLTPAKVPGAPSAPKAVSIAPKKAI